MATSALELACWSPKAILQQKSCFFSTAVKANEESEATYSQIVKRSNSWGKAQTRPGPGVLRK